MLPCPPTKYTQSSAAASVRLLSWTAPTATTTPRDHRLYQLDFSVNEWSERHDILLPEGLPTADARDEDAHAQRTEALAAIVASLRHASDP